MQIQLTKTKTITIGGGGAKRKHATDVVGIDLFSGDARGCPAVRLVERKGTLRVTAIGFLPPPAAPLPDSWEAAAKPCNWLLPLHFQAPSAAIAVTSPDMFFAQTTMDAFRADFAAGTHKSAEGTVNRSKRLGLRRTTQPAAPAPTTPAATATPTTLQPTAGVPISNGGTRFVMKPIDAVKDFVMEAGLPEYQILWLSRLLPEGHRPTAASVQLRPGALTASVLRQPTLVQADGATLAVFVLENEIQIAGYSKGDLVLWRTCHNVPAMAAIRKKINSALGLDDEAIIQGALSDTLIDPTPVLEPLIAPTIDELALSRDYLAGKLGVEVKSFLLFGIPGGVNFWTRIAQERAGISFTTAEVFAGIERMDKLYQGEGATLDGFGAMAFQGALGAALALFGEEAKK